ncbi:hypothetical protein HK102_008966 [Quaeritorhiza haematococci]|nr:hypothetical protein HK102_008966 [Quaeritorhiza haematococci]
MISIASNSHLFQIANQVDIANNNSAKNHAKNHANMSLFQIFENDSFFNDPFLRDPVATMFARPLLEQSSQSAPAQQQQQQVQQYQRHPWFRGPRLDVTETDKQYIIKADLPGLTKQDVHINVQDDVLMIEGERKQEKEEKDEKRHIVERSWGKFSRRIRLPEDVNLGETTAKMENGVLELVFGKKAEESRRMKIDIQ